MKLAILLATYNSSRYLCEQLDSLVNQTYNDFTIYARDDGSTDSTLQILESYSAKYGNIVILHDADYYMFCDHDDVWLPRKVELSLSKIRQIERDSRPAIVCTDLMVTDSDMKIISPSLWSYMKLHPQLLTQLNYAISCNLFTGCTMIINRAAKDVSLPVSPRAVMHDSWIGLKVLAAGGDVGWITAPQILYRQHSANLFGAHRVSRTKEYYLYKLRTIRGVATTYRQNFLMAKDALGGRISVAKYLIYRMLYLIRR